MCQVSLIPTANESSNETSEFLTTIILDLMLDCQLGLIRLNVI